MSDRLDVLLPDVAEHGSGTKELEQLLTQAVEHRHPVDARERIDGLVIGTLVGFLEAGIPLITYAGQRGTAALVARASIDLFPEHIGHDVTLLFEDGDPDKPIVTGRIRVPAAWPTADRPANVDVEADGARLTITAREQLVLRCGKASITLTSAGKILIQGGYISSRSTGVVRISGGSIQLN
jgi:Domain of unknown function (DUF6484)